MNIAINFQKKKNYNFCVLSAFLWHMHALKVIWLRCIYLKLFTENYRTKLYFNEQCPSNRLDNNTTTWLRFGLCYAKWCRSVLNEPMSTMWRVNNGRAALWQRNSTQKKCKNATKQASSNKEHTNNVHDVHEPTKIQITNYNALV